VPPAVPGKPAEKKPIYAPPRISVPVPGGGGAGMGFFSKLGGGGGGSAFLLFFISIGLGIFLFGVAGTVGPYRDSLRENGDPRFFYAAMGMGTLFVLVAARMLQIVLTSVEVERGWKRRGKKSEPWTWDYPWRPQGMGPDYASGAGGWIFGRIAFLAFIGFFNLAWGSRSWVLRGIILLFDAFGLVILLDSLRSLVQWLRFGRAEIAWKTFPAFLGERLEATVRFPRPLSLTGAARATLRCVQDEWTIRHTGKGSHRELQAVAIHSEDHEVPLAGGPLKTLDLAFELRDGLPGTVLDTEEATYWQLLLQVPTTGPDYETVFLAPVYSRRG
jgi:hypothetical protein